MEVILTPDFAELPGRLFFIFFKDRTKIAGAFKAAEPGNFRDCFFGIFNKPGLCLSYADGNKVIKHCKICVPFEKLAKIFPG